MADVMTCTTCGTVKHRRDGFPSRISAICWACAWKRHMREHHPLPWRERREIRKAVRRLARSKMIARAEDKLDAFTIACGLLDDDKTAQLRALADADV